MRATLADYVCVILTVQSQWYQMAYLFRVIPQYILPQQAARPQHSKLHTRQLLVRGQLLHAHTQLLRSITTASACTAALQGP